MLLTLYGHCEQLCAEGDSHFQPDCLILLQFLLSFWTHPTAVDTIGK